MTYIETDMLVWDEFIPLPFTSPLAGSKRAWRHESAYCHKALRIHKIYPEIGQIIEEFEKEGIPITNCDCMISTDRSS